MSATNQTGPGGPSPMTGTVSGANGNRNKTVTGPIAARGQGGASRQSMRGLPGGNANGKHSGNSLTRSGKNGGALKNTGPRA